MENDQLGNSQRITVYSDGKLPQSAEVKPAALLLTPAPIQCLKEELDSIYQMGPHFDALVGVILFDLKGDSHADDLRKTFRKFVAPMQSVTTCIFDAFSYARTFYVHDENEMCGECPRKTAKEMVSTLLDLKFQDSRLWSAHQAKESVTEAVRIMRTEVLPAMPALEPALDRYFRAYSTRIAAREERQNSWVPSVLQDALWGNVDPIPATSTEVKKLPQHLEEGIRIFISVPAFLDRLELFLRRLTEVNSQQVYELGYTTTDDLVRLYQDRFLCDAILGDMVTSWGEACEGFQRGVIDP